ncbi:MAG: response regulator [Janthinobacterium lividum]
MKLKKVADCKGEFALNTAHYFSSRLNKAAPQICRTWSNRQVRNLESTTRVLVVDDYEPAAEALATALGYEGFDTRFAFSGVEALGTIGAWVPHVIVLDINMPEHDGFETASVMRRLTATRNLGIIAFTALSDIEIETRAHLCGFDGYCQKGSPLQKLIGLIDGIVV